MPWESALTRILAVTGWRIVDTAEDARVIPLRRE